MSLSFPRSERLRGHKEITNLFTKSESLFLYPFKLFYLQREENSTSRFLISVPKRNFKRAVDRNLLKRRCREAYRLSPYRQLGKNYDLAFVFIGKEIVSFQFIDSKLNELLRKLKE